MLEQYGRVLGGGLRGPRASALVAAVPDAGRGSPLRGVERDRQGVPARPDDRGGVLRRRRSAARTSVAVTLEGRTLSYRELDASIEPPGSPPPVPGRAGGDEGGCVARAVARASRGAPRDPEGGGRLRAPRPELPEGAPSFMAGGLAESAVLSDAGASAAGAGVQGAARVVCLDRDGRRSRGRVTARSSGSEPRRTWRT